MKSKIGILALGQCGGNIGSIFETNGYNCLAINTCEQDLSTLTTVKFRYKIKGAEGCSHDRIKAINCIKENYRDAIEQIRDKLYHCSLIYLCFSTSGGTGSGFAPILLEMCNREFPDKHFGCIAVLPSDDEAPQLLMNAHQCYKEISQIERLASVFTLDNNKQKDILRINQLFFKKFDSIIDIPKYTNTKGNIDQAELFKMLTTRGNAIITNCNYSSTSDLTANLIRSWEETDIFADIEKDKHIKYLGLSTIGEPDKEALKRYIGTPFDVFQNYHSNSNISILSGLTFPKQRINNIYKKLEGNKDIIIKNLENSIDCITDDLDFLNHIKPPLPEILDTRPLEDILKKYAG